MTPHHVAPPQRRHPRLPSLAWIVSALVLVSLLGWSGVPATSAPAAPAVTLHSPNPGELHLTWPAATPPPAAYQVQYAPADTPTLIAQATAVTNTLTLYELEPGVVYTVQVRAGAGPWSAPVLQRIDDYRADPETVGTIGVGAGESGYIESAGDADWFFVDLAAGEDYPIAVTGAAAPPLAVYDTTGGAVHRGVVWRHAGALTFTPSTAGLYHLAVGGPGTRPGRYTLTVAEPPTPGPSPRRSRTLAGAVPAAAPAPRSPTAAPAKPTGLSATAAHDSVILTWDDPQDDSITGYVILRRNRDTDAQGQFTELAPDTGSAATSYSDASVAAGTPYTYRIKAINAHGSSERSRWFHIDTPAAPTPEPTPEPATSDSDDTSENDEPTAEPESVSEGDTDLPNDTSTPGRVAVGGSATGELERQRDHDWFRTGELSAGTTYRIVVRGQSSGGGTLLDPYLRRILNADGDRVHRGNNNMRQGYLDSRVDFTPDADGHYFIHVRSSETRGPYATGTYTVVLTDTTVRETAEKSVRADDDCAASVSTTCTIAVGDTGVTGNVEEAGDSDWFKVRLSRYQIYNFDLSGALSDKIVGRIYGAWHGSEVANLNTASTVFNAQATVTLDEYDREDAIWIDGDVHLDFYVEVLSESGINTGTYKLLITHKPDDCAAGGDVISECYFDNWTGRVSQSYVTGTIEHPDDVDWIRLGVHIATQGVSSNASFYRFGVRVYGSGTNPDYTLPDPQIVGVYDERGKLIPFTSNLDNKFFYAEGESWEPKDREPAIVFNAGGSGTYRIAVASELRYIGDYRVEAQFRKSSGDYTQDSEPNTPGSRVTEIRLSNGSGSARGAIQDSYNDDFPIEAFDVDFFKVSLTKDSTYRIDMRGYWSEHEETGCGLRSPWSDEAPDLECELTLTRPFLRGILNSDLEGAARHVGESYRRSMSVRRPECAFHGAGNRRLLHRRRSIVSDHSHRCRCRSEPECDRRDI